MCRIPKRYHQWTVATGMTFLLPSLQWWAIWRDSRWQQQREEKTRTKKRNIRSEIQEHSLARKQWHVLGWVHGTSQRSKEVTVYTTIALLLDAFVFEPLRPAGEERFESAAWHNSDCGIVGTIRIVRMKISSGRQNSFLVPHGEPRSWRQRRDCQLQRFTRANEESQTLMYAPRF